MSCSRFLGSVGTIIIKCKDLRIIQLDIPGMEECLNIASSIEVRIYNGKHGFSDLCFSSQGGKCHVVHVLFFIVLLNIMACTRLLCRQIPYYG